MTTLLSAISSLFRDLFLVKASGRTQAIITSIKGLSYIGSMAVRLYKLQIDITDVGVVLQNNEINTKHENIGRIFLGYPASILENFIKVIRTC